MQEHAPYHNLDVYRKAYQLALRIHKESLGFPKFEQYELAQQLRRSSKSIVVNVVEGMGRQDSPAEVHRFIRIAMGSCDESRIWLDFAKDLTYLDEPAYGQLTAGFIEIGKMLRGILNRYQALKATPLPKR